MNFIVKINPGSNIHGDNKTKTAVKGMTNVDISEPKMVEKGKFECPVCGKIFDSRARYDSHAMARHQSNSEAIIEKTMVAETDEQPPVALQTTEQEETLTACKSEAEGTTCTTT